MSESNELKKIKKVYGEKFMHFCREEFSTILEREGLLYEILAKYFSDNCRTLYEDLEKEKIKEGFRDFIYEKVDNYFNFNVKYEEKIEERNPYQILDEAGYELYECKTEEEIQNYRKYYIPTEELCTFRGGRLKRCVVFWAVKKNVDEIRREDFKNPRREDEYGTSVMSIQFERHGTCTVSIKNRYNHTLKNNPDATYGNDLNRIAPRLRGSFSKLLREEYGLELDNINVEEFGMPKGYVKANDGKYYKYNIEIAGMYYYCPGNIVIENGEPKRIENPESQILMDYFILDIKNKTIRLYDEIMLEDSFIEGLGDLKDSKIKVEKNKEKGTRVITIEKTEGKDIIIEIDKNNQIVGYKNENLQEVGNNFLVYSGKLRTLELSNLKEVGNNFLLLNEKLATLELPNLEKIENGFLYNNKKLTDLKLSKLKEVGDDFLSFNEILTTLELQNLERVGDSFLSSNEKLTRLYLPNLKEVGDDFLYNNKELTTLDLKKLKKIGNGFLYHNHGFKNLEIPNSPELEEQLKRQGFSIKDFVKNAVDKRIGIDAVRRKIEELRLGEKKEEENEKIKNNK